MLHLNGCSGAVCSYVPHHDIYISDCVSSEDAPTRRTRREDYQRGQRSLEESGAENQEGSLKKTSHLMVVSCDFTDVSVAAAAD